MAFNVMGAYSVVIAPQPCQEDKRRLRPDDGATLNGKCAVTVRNINLSKLQPILPLYAEPGPG